MVGKELQNFIILIMNRTLKQEAKEYAKTKSSSDVFKEAHSKDFIAGATSKYVEREKIKFAIEKLNDCKNYTSKSSKDDRWYDNQIEELEKQLNEL